MQRVSGQAGTVVKTDPSGNIKPDEELRRKIGFYKGVLQEHGHIYWEI